jgi:hypothetical protein
MTDADPLRRGRIEASGDLGQHYGYPNVSR